MNAPPEDLLERDCPHLAFIVPARYDQVIRLLKERNEKYRRGRTTGVDPRRNVSRKRTLWPGQSVHCGVCGRLYVYGGHGQTEHLMCSGAREYKCWNGITFDGPQACRALSAAFFDQLAALPDFEPAFLDELQTASSKLDDGGAKRRREVETGIQRLERETKNLVQAIREMRSSPAILAELRDLESKHAEFKMELCDLDRSVKPKLVLPSVDEVRRTAQETFAALAHDSQEFARCMRQLAAQIFVFPYRLCDGGHVVLRAEAHFSAVPFVPENATSLPGLVEKLSRVLVVDLFQPPQREAFREEIMRLTQVSDKPRKEREIAAELGITQPAVQRAKKLAREIAGRGLIDSYIATTEPPQDYGKLRRHLHKRYTFDPLDGFPRRWPK